MIWQRQNERNFDKIEDGDVRVMNLPVKVLFRWSDKIVIDVDSNGEEHFESGFLMHVFPNQCQYYSDHQGSGMFVGRSMQSEQPSYFNITKDDALMMVLGSTPPRSIMDDFEKVGLGAYVGGFVDGWNWNKSKLKEMSKDTLLKIRSTIKSNE
jgi:hypothetical protein